MRKELSGLDAVPPRRYRFSFFEKGRPLLVTVDTIVSEHYDDRDPIVARLMERFYFGDNWGWLRWEHWEKTGSAPFYLSQDVPMYGLAISQVAVAKFGGW